MYRTVKYNNANRHQLDEFDDLEAAIKSAEALHHPDWPTGQCIKVVDDDGKVLFDSSKPQKATETAWMYCRE